MPQGADNAEAEGAPTKSVTKSARFEDESLIELRKKERRVRRGRLGAYRKNSHSARKAA